MTPEPQWPLVSVNILAYNRRDMVRLTLQKTLDELDYPRDRLEIIVVDNESSDGTKEMLADEFPDVKVVVIEKNMGVPAWNKGFEVGSGDYFLVLDDDCFIVGDSLKLAVSGAQEEGADLVSFLVLNGYDHSMVFNSLASTGILEFWGCSALISARAIKQVGGFDPNIKFLSHELDFSMRFFDAGFKHLFLPEVHSYHMKPLLPHLKRWHTLLHGSPIDKILRVQRNRLGYIAGKSLQPRDGRAALWHMALKTLLASYRWPRLLLGLPGMVAGFRLGRQNHAPVRPEISRIYSKNFLEFANPLSYAGVPRNRRRFFRTNRRFYPGEKATLQL